MLPLQELEHTSATLAAMDLSDTTLTAAKDEFSSQKAGHRRWDAHLGTEPTVSDPVMCCCCLFSVGLSAQYGWLLRRSHKLLSTMRQHSLLDILTLWGGISIFTLVVVYIVTKRSLYFVPEFAKAPFRSAPKCARCFCSSLQQP